MKSSPNTHGITVIPRHVAIIMDGNGRWAKNRSFARIRGHRRGVQSVRAAVRTSGELGIEFLTLYAFSKENWVRPPNEINALMRLLEEFLKSEVNELNENNVQLHAIGHLDDLPERVLKQLRATQKATAQNTGLKLILALSYGARQEITHAMRQIAREVAAGKLSPAQINENTISQHLFTQEYPDPDLLIRTSGEMRVSNFLLWQISYAEFVISPALWPDFTRERYLDALQEYSQRQRRFGGV